MVRSCMPNTAYVLVGAKPRELQGDVVYLSWPIAPSYTSPNAHHVTWSPNKLWRSNSIFDLCLHLNASIMYSIVPFVISITCMCDHIRMIHTVLMRKYFFRHGDSFHIAEESERKLKMSSMELHKEIQGYITGKLYLICTLLSNFVLNSKYLKAYSRMLSQRGITQTSNVSSISNFFLFK